MITDPQDTRAIVHGKWSPIEAMLSNLLHHSVLQSDSLNHKQKSKWMTSVTEQEVRRGIIERSDPGNSICMQRDIAEFVTMEGMDPAEKNIIKRFVELSNSTNLQVDEKVQDKIKHLRSELKEKHVSIDEYVQSWAKGDGVSEETHSQYINEFGEKFYERVTNGLKFALSKQTHVSSECSEIAAHLVWGQKRAQAFFGRQEILQKGHEYIVHWSQPFPVVVHGISGSGKTSIMAAMALRSRDTIPTSVLVLRFCGISTDSSTGRSLLRSIVQQIYKAYFQNSIVPELFHELKTTFADSLKLATRSKPLLLVIDSLDQLSDENEARSDLSWLPTELPDNVHMIVSTLPDVGGCYKALKQTAIPPEHYLQLKPIDMNDAKDIVKGWMQKEGRTLQPEQEAKLLEFAVDGTKEEPTALRLRLLLDIAVKVKSNDQMPELPNSIRGLIEQFFEKLEHSHGELLVSHLFGLLSASVQGLGEQMLLDMLAADDDVLKSVLQYHKAPVKRIPQVFHLIIQT